MRLPTAYRSLSRPSSALEPSHPLYGLMCIYAKSLFQTYDGSSCFVLSLCAFPFIPVRFTGMICFVPVLNMICMDSARFERAASALQGQRSTN